MTRIICHYETCIFNREQICTSPKIEYDPDQGCLTAQDRTEFVGVLDDEDERDDEEEEDTFLHVDEEAELDDDELEDDDDEFLKDGDLEEEADEDEF